MLYKSPGFSALKELCPFFWKHTRGDTFKEHERAVAKSTLVSLLKQFLCIYSTEDPPESLYTMQSPSSYGRIIYDTTIFS